MVQEKKRKSRARSSQSRRLSGNVIDSNHGDVREADLVEIAQAYEVSNLEWDVPFDLTGIPGLLQASMLAVAPTLVGREAEYDALFFHQQVGLCDRGAMVDDIGMFYSHIVESEITKIWRVGNQPNCFEIVNCTDKEQARLFSKHCYEVYGHSPDNKYYSMRFLKAATATFVHGLEVKWVAEAMHCRSRRIPMALKNPRKLGSISLCRQVEGLCNIIRTLSRGTPSLPTVETSVDTAEKEAKLAAAAEISAAERLQALQIEKDDAEAVLGMCSTKDLADPEESTAAAVLKQKRLFRMGTPTDYKAQVEVVRGSSKKLGELQEALMTTRFTIDRLAPGLSKLWRSSSVLEHCTPKL